MPDLISSIGACCTNSAIEVSLNSGVLKLDLCIKRYHIDMTRYVFDIYIKNKLIIGKRMCQAFLLTVVLNCIICVNMSVMQWKFQQQNELSIYLCSLIRFIYAEKKKCS